MNGFLLHIEPPRILFKIHFYAGTIIIGIIVLIYSVIMYLTNPIRTADSVIEVTHHEAYYFC